TVKEWGRGCPSAPPVMAPPMMESQMSSRWKMFSPSVIKGCSPEPWYSSLPPYLSTPSGSRSPDLRYSSL
ncbi:hypothetical protein A2U01_0089599, partial [Trifolium medium]|nr:hypothetical protein [Trifolium medium]